MECGRFLEIWNLVFTTYFLHPDGSRTFLPAKNIDTGMGLERTAVILQGKRTLYETDRFAPIIRRVEELSGRRYGEDDATDRAMRIVADHTRAAAFLLAAGVVTGGRVCVRGVGSGSLQGDRVFLDYLARMGCRTESGVDWMAAEGPPATGLTASLNATPDLVPPLAAVALFAPGPSRLTGIGHLRLKESDRIAALAAETAKLGARVEQGAHLLDQPTLEHRTGAAVDALSQAAAVAVEHGQAALVARPLVARAALERGDRLAGDLEHLEGADNPHGVVGVDLVRRLGSYNFVLKDYHLARYGITHIVPRLTSNDQLL